MRVFCVQCTCSFGQNHGYFLGHYLFIILNEVKMYKYSHLWSLTDKEIHNLLLRRGIRGAEARVVREAVKAEKAQVRAAQAKKRTIKDLWRNIINPLVNEQRSVRSMLRYESERYPNPERREALKGYEALLKKLKLKLREYRYYAIRTPKEQALHEKEKGKPIPNDGAHWTDWVPPHVKKATVEAFLAIPRAAKARVKEPFPRTMSKADNAKLRQLHILTAKREHLEAEQEFNMIHELNKGQASEAARDAQARVDHIQNVLNWLICADDTEFIPRTWGELLVAKLPVVKLDVVP